MADTRTLAVLKFLKSGTTLASIKVRLAKAAVDSRKVSAEVVLADKPEKLKRSKLVIICSICRHNTVYNVLKSHNICTLESVTIRLPGKTDLMKSHIFKKRE